jgi:hypothetical protein
MIIEVIGITFAMIIVLLIIVEIATYITYDGYISKKVEEKFMNLNEKEISLNYLNPSIISTTPFITTHFSMLSKYYICGLGSVPRWSKLHKRIGEYYEIGLDKFFAEHLN